VVVVGAGPVAAAKLDSLAGTGALVVVVAVDAVERIREAARSGAVTWLERAYEPQDLDGAVLVVAATSDAGTNARVAADADSRATLCVRVDGGGTAALAATVRRGPLLLSVSTSGAAPALGRRLRGELERAYGPEYGALAELLGALRRDPVVMDRLHAMDATERRARWRAVLDTDILAHVRNGRTDLAREVAIACLSSSSV
jgi:precorrin-2 dehydrogenase/sirohydrochlorin ferrochelatase